MAEKNTYTPTPENSALAKDSPIFGMGDQQHHFNKQQQHIKILWGIFSLLLVLVLGVIFILPSYISTPDPAAVAPVVIPIERATPQNALSPFQEAQLLREREAAQNILEQILNLQGTLEGISIEIWADEAYEAALSIATEGDTAYREQDFIGAQEIYQRSLLALQSLETESLLVLSSSIDEGYAAIESGLQRRAEESFSRALLINPESVLAQNGLSRAQTLGEVLELIELGNQERARGNLEIALQRYEDALVIDSEHAQASAAISQTNQEILDRDFRNHMSAGFSAIQQNDPQAALQSFNQALTMRPNSGDVEAAIVQAETMIMDRDLNIQLIAAREHEAAEEWQDALSAYNTALAIDANVVAAQQGRDRSQQRLNLDNYLKNILNNPLRLSDDQVYQQSITVYNESLSLVTEGSRLYNQLSSLRSYLDRARLPITVTLNSDGVTDVTIFRITELGTFVTQTMQLIPGAYTAVGVRVGYRDVRQEFVVPFSGEEPIVTVICNEPV
jgi:tetratricopeptide (TPR) repeat protein